jgi:hypothetical protein
MTGATVTEMLEAGWPEEVSHSSGLPGNSDSEDLDRSRAFYLKKMHGAAQRVGQDLSLHRQATVASPTPL